MIRKLNGILILLIMCGFSIWLWLSICWESTILIQHHLQRVDHPSGLHEIWPANGAQRAHETGVLLLGTSWWIREGKKAMVPSGKLT
jgi:hypothetical protein